MPAKQVVVVKTTTTRTRAKANGSSKSLSSNRKKVGTTNKRGKGNPNRCSQCGRYL